MSWLVDSNDCHKSTELHDFVEPRKDAWISPELCGFHTVAAYPKVDGQYSLVAKQHILLCDYNQTLTYTDNSRIWGLYLLQTYNALTNLT